MTEYKGHNIFLLMAGGGSQFVSVQGEGQKFLGALFRKLVALPPAK